LIVTQFRPCQKHFKEIAVKLATRDIDMADRDICFGSRSSSFWPLIIGALIILVGVIELFGDTYRWLNWDNVWPLIVIAFGLLIVGNALYKR
jgi:hypothetical protein